MGGRGPNPAVAEKVAGAFLSWGCEVFARRMCRKNGGKARLPIGRCGFLGWWLIGAEMVKKGEVSPLAWKVNTRAIVRLEYMALGEPRSRSSLVQ